MFEIQLKRQSFWRIDSLDETSNRTHRNLMFFPRPSNSQLGGKGFCLKFNRNRRYLKLTQNIAFLVEIQRELFHFKTEIQINRIWNIDIAARWKPILIFPISIFCCNIYWFVSLFQNMLWALSWAHSKIRFFRVNAW